MLYICSILYLIIGCLLVVLAWCIAAPYYSNESKR